MKKGLIMEGGALRGVFTCGVIDVFMENGIEFDGAAGISAGAAFGCNYKSKQIGRGIRYNKKYCKDPRYCSIRSLITTGNLFGAEFCYKTLPEELDVFDTETFKANPMEFYVGAVDVNTGEMRYHKCVDGGKNDLRWIRASASMPMVSKPVRVEGHKLLDGGIVDSVPYKYMEDLGYDRNVIILTQPAGYMKKKSAALPLAHLMLRKYPVMRDVMDVRHIRYNQQMREINDREKAGISLVIRPPYDLGISRTESDPDELERVYRIGRKVATERLEEVKRFLSM